MQNEVAMLTFQAILHLRIQVTRLAKQTQNIMNDSNIQAMLHKLMGVQSRSKHLKQSKLKAMKEEIAANLRPACKPAQSLSAVNPANTFVMYSQSIGLRHEV